MDVTPKRAPKVSQGSYYHYLSIILEMMRYRPTGMGSRYYSLKWEQERLLERI